jgi:hypothetical protein
MKFRTNLSTSPWQRNFQRKLKIKSLEKAFEGTLVQFNFFAQEDVIEVFFNNKLIQIWKASENKQKIIDQVRIAIKEK